MAFHILIFELQSNFDKRIYAKKKRLCCRGSLSEFHNPKTRPLYQNLGKPAFYFDLTSTIGIHGGKVSL